MDKFLIRVKRKRGKDKSVEDECKAHSEPSGSESITSNRDREAENIENINELPKSFSRWKTSFP